MLIAAFGKFKLSCDYIADKYNWNKINCVESEALRSIDSIHEEIYKLVIDRIKSMER